MTVFAGCCSSSTSLAVLAPGLDPKTLGSSAQDDKNLLVQTICHEEKFLLLLPSKVRTKTCLTAHQNLKILEKTLLWERPGSQAVPTDTVVGLYNTVGY